MHMHMRRWERGSGLVRRVRRWLGERLGEGTLARCGSAVTRPGRACGHTRSCAPCCLEGSAAGRACMRERRWPGARALGQTRAAARGSGPARLARLLGYARLGRGSARWAGEGTRWADARRWPGGLRAGRQAAGAMKFCGPRGCGRPFSFCFSTFSNSSFFSIFYNK
jgi:hypothetical protein